MRKAIALLTILLASILVLIGAAASLFAQSNNQQAKTIPNADLPRSPRPSLLQKLQNEPDELTDSEKQEYIDILYDYYRVSTTLEQQLVELGNPINYRLDMPPFRGIHQIDDTDLDLFAILMFQVNQARRLLKAVEESDPIVPNFHIAEIHRNMFNVAKRSDSVVFELKREIMELNRKLKIAEFEKDKNDIYKELLDNSENAIYQLRTIMKKYTIPVWGLSVGAAKNFYSEYENASFLAPSVGIYLNPTTILGVPDIFDIWVDYSYSTDKIASANVAPATTMEHNLATASAGLNLHFPVSKYIKQFNLFDFYIKAGVGWFWMIDKIPNKPNPYFYTNIWYGHTYKVELELVNLTSKFPVALYCAYSWKSVDKNLTYITNQNFNVDLEYKKFNSINAGFKFFITTYTPFNRER